MRVNSPIPVAALLACVLVLTSGIPASAQFSAAEQSCRAAVVKNATKLSKTILKATTGCHKSRIKDGALSGTNCNDIDQADTKQKVAGAESKMTAAISGATSKCAGLDPSDVLYNDCPAPCAGAITDFGDVATCLICLSRSNAESFSEETNGMPVSPLVGDSAKCQAAIGKEGAKLYNTVLKDVGKCQTTAEKAGTDTITGCTVTSFPSSKVDAAKDKAFASIAEACASANFAELDSCGATQSTVAMCVSDAALSSAQEMISQDLQLGVGAPTTTTTTTLEPTTTTSTTLPPGDSHPQCPNLGQLVLFSQDTNIPCTNNGDCDLPRTCDDSVGVCRSLTELDSGWTGISHDSDINDSVLTRARLACPGPPSPGCGECTVLGISETDNCRCANNTRTICDEPFVADANDCGGAVCNCYFGSPFPLSAGATPACVVNRFGSDVTGTANVDTGSGEITARLRTVVYLGASTTNPCPVCGGRCSDDQSGCLNNADCGVGPTCTYDTPSDGIRNGTCVGGAHSSQSCDVNGINASFPAFSAVPGGGGYSLDCFPNSPNVSGAGLIINLTQVTGSQQISATLDCDGSGPGTKLCPCKICSSNPSAPCNLTSDCTEGPVCAVGTFFGCTSDTNCDSLNLGTCSGLNRCQRAQQINCGAASSPPGYNCQNYNGSCLFNWQALCDADNDCTSYSAGTCGLTGQCTQSGPSGSRNCTTNADCTGVSSACDLSPCKPNECANIGSGLTPQPDQCSATCTGDPQTTCTVNADCLPDNGTCPAISCVDIGGGEGECSAGPDERTCDGVVRASGGGILGCNTNADCTPGVIGVDGGDCTLVKRRECFLDPIVATGDADPDFPIGAAAFCIPPTSNFGINSVAGLPGPGRIRNQATSTTYCTSNNAIEYQPGGGACPP